MTDPLDFLVVGAGISGLLAASGPTAAGHDGLVLEKSRGLGGRMATRRMEGETFDHGAQFMTAREETFRTLIGAWRRAGLIEPWFRGESADAHVRFRGAPGMTAVPKYLAAGLAVERGVQVESVRHDGRYWHIDAGSDRRWVARVLVLSAPVPQSLTLLAAGGMTLDPDLDRVLPAISYDPCFALMVSLAEEGCALRPPGWVRPDSGPIAWLADNRLKGISLSDRPALTLHASIEFSRDWFDADPAEVITRLLEAAEPWIKGKVLARRLHRWRYSQPVNSLPARFMADHERRLVFCGDAFGGARVEGAALSGLAAGDQIQLLLQDTFPPQGLSSG